jgi:regulator of RNase E activity RraB
MRDGWDWYEGWSDGKPARIELDMRLAEEVPIADRPWLLRLRFPRDDAADEGFVSEVLHMVRTRYEAVLVARVLTEDYVEFVLHGTRHDGLKEAIVPVVTRHWGRKVRIRTAHDSPWLHVRERVMPNRYQYQWMQDRRVVEAMRQGGDRIEVPRPIDHTVYFRSVEARERFAKAVAAIGFEADAATDGDGHLRFGLIVRRRDPVTLEHIHAVVCELIKKAEEVGGQYDGWGAPLVTR